MPSSTCGDFAEGVLGELVTEMSSAATGKPPKAPSAALRPLAGCSRLPHFVGEAKEGAQSPVTGQRYSHPT